MNIKLIAASAAFIAAFALSLPAFAAGDNVTDASRSSSDSGAVAGAAAIANGGGGGQGGQGGRGGNSNQTQSSSSTSRGGNATGGDAASQQNITQDYAASKIPQQMGDTFASSPNNTAMCIEGQSGAVGLPTVSVGINLSHVNDDCQYRARDQLTGDVTGRAIASMMNCNRYQDVRDAMLTYTGMGTCKEAVMFLFAPHPELAPSPETPPPPPAPVELHITVSAMQPIPNPPEPPVVMKPRPHHWVHHAAACPTNPAPACPSDGLRKTK